MTMKRLIFISALILLGFGCSTHTGNKPIARPIGPLRASLGPIGSSTNNPIYVEEVNPVSIGDISIGDVNILPSGSTNADGTLAVGAANITKVGGGTIASNGVPVILQGASITQPVADLNISNALETANSALARTPTNGIVVAYGSDGTVMRAVKVDTSGNLILGNASDTNANAHTWSGAAWEATRSTNGAVSVVLNGYTNSNPLVVSPTQSTNQIQDGSGKLLLLNSEGSLPVTMPAAAHVSVVPYTTTSAVADGQALSYNFTVSVTRSNSYITGVSAIDVETNAPASMNKKAFDVLIYADAITAQTPATAHQVTAAEHKTLIGIYSVTADMWQTNRLVNGFPGTGVVHCPGFARMTNSFNGNILSIPAGTALTCSLKARATYTPQETNEITIGFDFLPVK